MDNYTEAQAAFEKMRAARHSALKEYQQTMAGLGWTVNSYGSYEDRGHSYVPSSYTGGFDQWGRPLEETTWSPLPTD